MDLLSDFELATDFPMPNSSSSSSSFAEPRETLSTSSSFVELKEEEDSYSPATSSDEQETTPKLIQQTIPRSSEYYRSVQDPRIAQEILFSNLLSKDNLCLIALLSEDLIEKFIRYRADFEIAVGVPGNIPPKLMAKWLNRSKGDQDIVLDDVRDLKLNIDAFASIVKDCPKIRSFSICPKILESMPIEELYSILQMPSLETLAPKIAASHGPSKGILNRERALMLIEKHPKGYQIKDHTLVWAGLPRGNLTDKQENAIREYAQQVGGFGLPARRILDALLNTNENVGDALMETLILSTLKEAIASEDPKNRERSFTDFVDFLGILPPKLLRSATDRVSEFNMPLYSRFALVVLFGDFSFLRLSSETSPRAVHLEICKFAKRTFLDLAKERGIDTDFDYPEGAKVSRKLFRKIRKVQPTFDGKKLRVVACTDLCVLNGVPRDEFKDLLFSVPFDSELIVQLIKVGTGPQLILEDKLDRITILTLPILLAKVIKDANMVASLHPCLDSLKLAEFVQGMKRDNVQTDHVSFRLMTV